MVITRYGRFWAVYDADGTLVCVCVYLKGARGRAAAHHAASGRRYTTHARGVCQGNTDKRIRDCPIVDGLRQADRKNVTFYRHADSREKYDGRIMAQASPRNRYHERGNAPRRLTAHI